MGLRVKPAVELEGMDINEHGEEGYGEEFGTMGDITGPSAELR